MRLNGLDGTPATGRTTPRLIGTRRRATSRRWLVAMAALATLVVAMVTPASSAQAAGPAAASAPITTLPFFGSGDVSGQGTGGRGTAAGNAAVSQRCNAGAGVFAPQWYALPPADLGTVIARVDAPYYPRGVDQNPSGVAFVDTRTGAVLACDGAPRRVRSTQAVSVVAYYTQSVASCVPGEWCAEGSLRLYVGKTTGVAPSNDHWAGAKVIGSLPYTDVVDTALADGDGPALLDYSSCFLSFIEPAQHATAWWRYTPRTTSTLPLAVDLMTSWNQLGPYGSFNPRVSVVELTAAGPVLAPRQDPDDCDSPVVLRAGKAYGIAVFTVDDSYSDSTLVTGGPLTLRVGAVRTPRAPLGVHVSTNPAARTATLSWSAPTSPGASPVTGYRVARDGHDSFGVGPWSKVVSAGTRSLTFKYLRPWDAYNLTVQAVNASGKGSVMTAVASLTASTPSAPRATAVSRTGSTATVSWTAPTASGASAVTAYKVRRYSASGRLLATTTVKPDARSVSIKGLTAGKAYAFDVAAVNAAGAGRASCRVTAPSRRSSR